MSFLLVGAGGVVGALLRYQLTRWISERWMVSFPFATLLINVSGSYLLGLFTRELGVWWPAFSTSAMLFLGTGLCGAYTTFSTLSYEFTMLAREQRLWAAATYALLTALLGFAAAGLGLFGWPR